MELAYMSICIWSANTDSGTAGMSLAGSNPGHHFLASYRRALMGICQAQFTGKALKVCKDSIKTPHVQPAGTAAYMQKMQW